MGASRTWGRPVQSRLTKNKWRYDDVTHAEDEEDPSKQSAIFVDGAAPPLFVRGENSSFCWLPCSFFVTNIVSRVREYIAIILVIH